MAQEFTINSSAIENKINQLLPSQGGFGAGIDFSASTMVIPIVDLTESAEGGTARQDLQTALSLVSVTSFAVTNATTTLITTTGYFRVFGTIALISSAGDDKSSLFTITDGTTSKIVYSFFALSGAGNNPYSDSYDFIVFLQAGDSLTCTSTSDSTARGVTRQIADISGNLVNP